MRLINRSWVMIAYLGNLGLKDSYKAKYEALAKAIDEAPIIEAEPVRHGYDTGICRMFHCSVCGYGVNDIYQENEQDYPVGEFNYCPNCGCKMDAEV